MNKTEKWIYMLLVLMATFLMVDRFLMPCAVAIGIMYGILVSRDFKFRACKMLSAMLIVVLTVVVTMTLSVFPTFSQLIDTSASIKELLRIAIYIMVLQIMTMINLDIGVYKALWKMITVITVAVVILQFTKIVDMNGLLKSFYGDSKQFIRAEENELSEFRGGSVFVNPNVFACFLAAMLASYQFALRSVKESVLSKIVMFALIVTGFVLTGSRTGMILATVLILYHIYSTSRLGPFTFIKNVMLIAAGIAGVSFLLRVVLSVSLSDLFGLRMFQVEAGIENSFGAKIEIFIRLLKNMNFMNLFVGYGAYDYARNVDNMVDFDLGYFVTYFGLSGLGAYLLLLSGIYKWGNRELAGRRMLNTMLFLLMLIFGMTAGVYFNLRLFTICLLVFMPALTDMKAQERLA